MAKKASSPPPPSPKVTPPVVTATPPPPVTSSLNAGQKEQIKNVLAERAKNNAPSPKVTPPPVVTHTPPVVNPKPINNPITNNSSLNADQKQQIKDVLANRSKSNTPSVNAATTNHNTGAIMTNPDMPVNVGYSSPEPNLSNSIENIGNMYDWVNDRAEAGKQFVSFIKVLDNKNNAPILKSIANILKNVGLGDQWYKLLNQVRGVAQLHTEGIDLLAKGVENSIVLKRLEQFGDVLTTLSLIKNVNGFIDMVNSNDSWAKIFTNEKLFKEFQGYTDGIVNDLFEINHMGVPFINPIKWKNIYMDSIDGLAKWFVSGDAQKDLDSLIDKAMTEIGVKDWILDMKNYYQSKTIPVSDTLSDPTANAGSASQALLAAIRTAHNSSIA